MATVRQMQGVPAHLETLKAKDKHRHPARCIFVEKMQRKYTCMCPHCNRYTTKCSTQRCENYEDWNEIYIGTENENLTNANIVYNSPLTNTSLTDLDYLTYVKNDDNTISITDCSNMATRITIPAIIDGLPVTSINENEITISDAEINDNVVSFTLELVTTHTMQGTILVGVYDDNGTLVNIMSYPAKESNDISFTKQDNDSTVKVFWWYDSDIIFPMAKNAELALTDENAV